MFDGLKLRAGRGVFGERGPLATSCIDRRRDNAALCALSPSSSSSPTTPPGLRPPRVRHVPAAHL